VFVEADRPLMLLVWTDLTKFLPWLLDIGWWKIWTCPVLPVACFVDGYKKFRFSPKASAGQVQVLLKLIIPGITHSPFTVIPIARYTGPEKYQYLNALLKDRVFRPLLSIERDGFLWNGQIRYLKIVFIPDGSCHPKLFQIGSPSGEYPIAVLPIHRTQLGDSTLLPSQFCRRLEEQELLTQQWLDRSIPDVSQYSENQRSKLSRLHFGISLRANLTDRDVCDHLVGPNHLEACIRGRTQIVIYYLAKSFSDVAAENLSQILWHTKEFEKKIKTSPPQMDGLQCRRLSTIFLPHILPVFTNVSVRSCLRFYMHALNTITYHVYTNRDCTFKNLWWDGRMLFLLFVNLFGETHVTPSLFNLCVCGPLYVKRIEELGKEVDIPLVLSDFSDFVCEAGHKSAKEEEKASHKRLVFLNTTELDPVKGKADTQIHQFYITLEGLKRRGDYLHHKLKKNPQKHTHKIVWGKPQKSFEQERSTEIEPLKRILRSMMILGTERDPSPPSDITLETASEFQKTIPPKQITIRGSSLVIGKWHATVGTSPTTQFTTFSTFEKQNLLLSNDITPLYSNALLSCANAILPVVDFENNSYRQHVWEMHRSVQNYAQHSHTSNSVSFEGRHLSQTRINVMGAEVTLQNVFELKTSIDYDIDSKKLNTILMEWNFVGKKLNVVLETVPSKISQFADHIGVFCYRMRIPFRHIYALRGEKSRHGSIREHIILDDTSAVYSAMSCPRDQEFLHSCGVSLRTP
jgi:hypothetical protein